MLLAADGRPHGLPSAAQFGWILVAMVGARSSAMAFNRIADLRFDRANPRTAGWALPSGAVSVGAAWAFCLLSAGVFIVAAAMLNRLTLALAPVALALIWGYSYTKRFTAWSHIALGLALGVAPVGAWIAVRGSIGLPALILSAAVILWVAGFDILYALQDVEFDRKVGLHSVPGRYGVRAALGLSSALHVAMVGMLVALRLLAPLGAIYLVGVGVTALFLVYEHRLVRPDDLRRLNAAFFTVNGVVSVGLLAFTAADLLLK
jgi:4-hydroxybenzoate polyprenyltransferase